MSNKKITLDLAEYNELLDEKERLKSVNNELVKGATVVYRPEIVVKENIHYDTDHGGYHEGFSEYSVQCQKINQEDYEETLQRLKKDISQMFNLRLEMESLEAANKDMDAWKYQKEREYEEHIERSENYDKVKWTSFFTGVILTVIMFYLFGG